VAKTDDNLDKMSDLLGSLNSLAVNMNNEVAYLPAPPLQTPTAVKLGG
jgi:hypothetical protein